MGGYTANTNSTVGAADSDTISMKLTNFTFCVGRASPSNYKSSKRGSSGGGGSSTIFNAGFGAETILAN